MPNPTPPAEVDVAEGRRLFARYKEYGDDGFEFWLWRNRDALLTAAEQVAGLRRALETIAFGPIVACPFDSQKCAVKPDEPCPVCGDVNDFDAPTNCGTGNARAIARSALGAAP